MLKIFRRFLKPYRLQVAGLMLFQAVQTAGTLFLPDLNSSIIDQGVVLGDQGYVWRTGLIMFGIAVAQVVAQFSAIWLGSRVALKVGRDIRKLLFDHVQTISEYEVGVFGAPSLITRATNDINQIQMLIMFLFTIIISAPIMLIGGVVFAVRQDLELSIIFVVIIPILASLLGWFLWRTIPLFARWQQLIDKINQIMREQINGVRPIKAFGREKTEQARFAVANDEITNVNYRIGTKLALMMPFVFSLINLCTAAILTLGGLKIQAGTLHIGALTAYITYTLFILVSIMMSMMIIFMWPRASVSARRVQQVLNIEPSVIDNPQIATPKRIRSLEYRDVKFYYKGAQLPILEGINFRVTAPAQIAIVGATGSGKSTIVKMLPRLFDPSDGQIRINGSDTRKFSLYDLRELIGFVPQKAVLFEGTLRENLRFGNPHASDADCLAVLKTVSALDFLSGDHILDFAIDQGGNNLSGGQNQRLAMARALIRKPPILIFDDSFSALDANTEHEIRQNLAHNQAAVLIVVSQNIASIQHSDLILVIDHGHIIGAGKHEALLEECAVYREIQESQKYLGADFDE
jgi:ATP-binding cassette subfamily B protein